LAIGRWEELFNLQLADDQFFDHLRLKIAELLPENRSWQSTVCSFPQELAIHNWQVIGFMIIYV
jgi:hypothetical protein